MLRDNNGKKKHPCHTKLCAFRCLISRPQILNLRSRNQIRGKLLLSRKLRHFRGSHFSQCFIISTLILSTSPHYSLPSEVFILSTNSVHCLYMISPYNYYTLMLFIEAKAISSLQAL